MATFTKYGQYSLTRPFTKNSEAHYWTIIEFLFNGGKVNAQHARNIDCKYMTYQALREANLIENIDGYYEITPKGIEYVKYYQNDSHPSKTFFEQYRKETSKTTGAGSQIDEQSISIIFKIQTTNNLYKVQVKRTNGANVYVERYDFENESDARIAKEIMDKAENTSAELV